MSDFALPADLFDRQHAAPGKRLSMALAIGMHVVLALFLFYGVRWQTHAPEPVQVELVRAVPQELTFPPAPKPSIEPEPKPEPKPEPQPAPKVEPKPPAKAPDIALKEKEKPKPEPKVEPKVESKPDKLKEMLKRETEQLERDKKLSSLDKELADAKAVQSAERQGKAMAAWISKIRDKIRGNIVLPPDVRGNPEAIFTVNQLPTGEIISASLARSSGNLSLDAAIERAILKSSPLPKAEPRDLFERTLELKFRPLEN